MSGNLAGIMVILGPIVLALVIAWAIFHNRGSKSEMARTEDATRRMYDEQDRADKATEAG